MSEFTAYRADFISNTIDTYRAVRETPSYVYLKGFMTNSEIKKKKETETEVFVKSFDEAKAMLVNKAKLKVEKSQILLEIANEDLKQALSLEQ